jgi:rod shape determining protein RodA
VHVIINTGMCLRLMPVTGVPLPLVSYGGSNLLTNLLAIGIVLNISRHRKSRREWANSEPLVRV